MTSPHALIVRMPSGTEYWYVEDVPDVGDIVSYHGTRYVVLSSKPSDDERIVITLEEEELTTDRVVKSPLA